MVHTVWESVCLLALHHLEGTCNPFSCGRLVLNRSPAVGQSHKFLMQTRSVQISAENRNVVQVVGGLVQP